MINLKIVFVVYQRKDLVRFLIMLVNYITKIPGIYSYTGKNIKIKFYELKITGLSMEKNIKI